MSVEIRIPVEGGRLTALDHGGAGRPILLAHGSGHNAAAWTEVATALAGENHVVAVDLRGHGHSTAESTDAEQYWRDLGAVVDTLGWQRPVLVGHSTGGYAVTAATAAGLLDPAVLCVVDGLVLDDRATAAAMLAEFRSEEAAAELTRVFGYGLRLSAKQAADWIDRQATHARLDWLNAGADPDLVRAVAARSLRPDSDGSVVRRPTTAEIAMTTTAAPDAAVYPSVDLYDRITQPLAVVLPDQGFYAHRRAEVARIVAAGPRRQLIDTQGGHNVVMTRPKPLADIIRTLAEQYA